MGNENELAEKTKTKCSVMMSKKMARAWRNQIMHELSCTHTDMDWFSWPKKGRQFDPIVHWNSLEVWKLSTTWSHSTCLCVPWQRMEHLVQINTQLLKWSFIYGMFRGQKRHVWIEKKHWHFFSACKTTRNFFCTKFDSQRERKKSNLTQKLTDAKKWKNGGRISKRDKKTNEKRKRERNDAFFYLNILTQRQNNATEAMNGCVGVRTKNFHLTDSPLVVGCLTKNC